METEAPATIDSNKLVFWMVSHMPWFSLSYYIVSGNLASWDLVTHLDRPCTG